MRKGNMEKTKRRTRGRDFKMKVGEKELTLYFKRPNQRELFDIDLSYRTAMTRLLKSGVMTSYAALKTFDASGDWTKEDESGMRNHAILIAQLSRQLEEGKDKPREERLRLAEKISEHRAKQLELINRKNDLFSNCAETLAEQQKMHTLAVLCCIESEGEKFFASEQAYQDFVVENVDAASVIFAEAYAFDYGVEVENFGQDWAEVKFYREEAEKEKAEKSAAAELAAEEVAAEMAIEDQEAEQPAA